MSAMVLRVRYRVSRLCRCRISLVAPSYVVLSELLAPFAEVTALVLVPAGLAVRAVDLDDGAGGVLACCHAR
jgi:hypothetical protein